MNTYKNPGKSLQTCLLNSFTSSGTAIFSRFTWIARSHTNSHSVRLQLWFAAGGNYNWQPRIPSTPNPTTKYVLWLSNEALFRQSNMGHYSNRPQIRSHVATNMLNVQQQQYIATYISLSYTSRAWCVKSCTKDVIKSEHASKQSEWCLLMKRHQFAECKSPSKVSLCSSCLLFELGRLEGFDLLGLDLGLKVPPTVNTVIARWLYEQTSSRTDKGLMMW